MERALTMPKLGMTMTEGTVLRWLYQEGELVEKGEPLVEVMTDKVNMEVEAPFSGILKSIHAKDGDVLPIGAPLATLVDETLAGNTIDRTSTQTARPSTPLSNTEFDRAQPIPSTPAAKREAALQGISLHSVLQAGATPPLDRTDVLNFVQHAQGNTQTAQPEHLAPQKPVRATPIAQKIAHEHQLDLTTIAERKAGEKITRADVEAHLTTTVGARFIAPSSPPPADTPTTVGARFIVPSSPTTCTHKYTEHSR